MLMTGRNERSAAPPPAMRTKKEVQRKKHIGTQIVDADGKSKRNRSRYQGGPVVKYIPRKKYEERST